MDLQLSGKRVFVTGASKGIGLAVARAFRQEGARVAINSSNPQNLARAQEVLGGDCLTLGGDLGDIDSIGSIFAQLEERWGGLDILVNNAAKQVQATYKTGSKAFDIKVVYYYRLAGTSNWSVMDTGSNHSYAAGSAAQTFDARTVPGNATPANYEVYAAAASTAAATLDTVGIVTILA